MKRSRYLLALVLACLAGGGWYVWSSRAGGGGSGSGSQVRYRTSRLSPTRIVQEVSATGTIQPLHEVEVGTQVTGKILELKADYNSLVKAGELLARIDPATYQATYDASRASIRNAEASLASAKAQLSAAKATLAVNESKLKYAIKTHQRNSELRRKLPETGISDADLDTSEAEVEQLQAQILSNRADIEKAEAAIIQSEAQIQQAEANGRQAEANLGYCTISAPIDGIVIARDVDEGQTVVSNMNTSTLFTIAAGLTRIQVEAAVPEADVGQLKVGQKVRFTVDAYPHEFVGSVREIRLDAQSESNVVTYPVIVEADNPRMELFPGMTANLSIIIVEKEHVIAVPAAALRFKGPQNQAADSPAPAAAPAHQHQQASGKSRPDGAPRPEKASPSPSVTKTIWLANDDGSIRPQQVRLGASDGINTEIIGGDDLDGALVVTGIMTSKEAEKAASGSNNPFAPPRPPRGGPGGPPRR